MDPSMSDIRYFQEVVKTQNISRASERLMIRQSSLSAAIQRLELAIGASLFHRSRNGVKLTHAGQSFLQKCHELVTCWEQVKTTVNLVESEMIGNFTIGCHPNPARYILPMFIPVMTRKYPKIRLQLFHERSQILNEMVISSKLDFAIVSLTYPHPDLVRISLGRDLVGFWAHKDLEVTPEKSVLIFDPEFRHSQMALRELSQKKIEFQNTLSTSSIEVAWALAEAKAGVAIMPNNPVEFAKSTELRLLDWLPQIKGELSLIYRAGSQRTKAAKEIVKLIRKYTADKMTHK
jgi:LysR family transcriptional regulator, cell division regulator